MKKKRFLNFLTTVLLFVLFTALSVQAEEASLFSGGTGTADDPYLISRGGQLDSIGSIDSTGKYFKLVPEESYSYIPMGYFTGGIEGEFNGTLDGNGYTLYYLYNAMFNTIGASGVVCNLTISSPNSALGGICGKNYGTISNCTVDGGTTDQGGICNYCEGTITDCTVVRCQVMEGDGEYAGGICGWLSKGKIIRCTLGNSCSVNGKSNVGGICGLLSAGGSIIDCESSLVKKLNTIEGTVDNNYAGGICGRNDGGTITPSTIPGSATPTTTPDSATPSTTPDSEIPPSTLDPTPEKSPAVSDSAPGKVQKFKAVSKKKQTAVLSWKKTKNVKGYQIEYSLNKKFKKQTKSKNVKKTSATIKKLKKGKIYYFRIRAFKVSKGKKVYGKWSTVKKVKIKK